jgi:carbon storage regulator CsrA
VVGEPDGVDCLLKVIVLEIKAGAVRLGFEADSSVPVHRTEIWEEIRARGETPGPMGPLPRG